MARPKKPKRTTPKKASRTAKPRKRAKRKPARKAKAPKRKAPKRKPVRKAKAPKRKAPKRKPVRKAKAPKRRPRERAQVSVQPSEGFTEIYVEDEGGPDQPTWADVSDYDADITPVYEDSDEGDEDDGPELPTFGERDAEMFEGAQELYEGVYSREEIAEYIDDLADYFDMDPHDLYDMYYGYSDDTGG